MAAARAGALALAVASADSTLAMALAPAGCALVLAIALANGALALALAQRWCIRLDAARAGALALAAVQTDDKCETLAICSSVSNFV